MTNLHDSSRITQDPLERDLDALGRALGADAPTPMPAALLNVVADRANSRALLRNCSWLAGAALLAILGVVAFKLASPAPGHPDGEPASARTLPRLDGPLPATSIAAIRTATHGLEGSAMLDSIPTPPRGFITSTPMADLVPRLGESLDSPNARLILGRD
jgi:hypothetical protein